MTSVCLATAARGDLLVAHSQHIVKPKGTGEEVRAKSSASRPALMLRHNYVMLKLEFRRRERTVLFLCPPMPRKAVSHCRIRKCPHWYRVCVYILYLSS